MKILFVIGSWQAVVGLAAIRSASRGQNDLSLVVFVQRGNERDMFQTCEAFFRNIGVETILLRFREFTEGKIPNSVSKAIRRASEVYFPFTSNFLNFTGWPDLVYEKINFYEDGLHSVSLLERLFSRLEKDASRSWFDRLKLALRDFPNRNASRTKNVDLKIRNLSDFHQFWGILPYGIQYHSLQDVDILFLKESLQIFSKLEPCSGRDRIIPGTVILGSNFAMFGMLSADREYDLIIRFIESSRDQETIYWKPHPRASWLYTEYLLGKCPEVRLWPVKNSSIPFECHIEEQPDLRIVSIMSTSLAYAKILYQRDVRMLGDISELLAERGQELLPSYNYLRSMVGR
ncbi:MAG: polysialyltransferase family glycosyltransferase [Puniceicoccaceae bacterium]